MEENNQPSGNKRVYVIIIALLLIINGIAVVLLYSERRAKNDLGEQKTKLEQEFHSLSDSLDSKKAELEQFRGRNVELDSIINAKQDDIDKQKKQITSMLARGKMNAVELEKAKGMISQYEASIADLQKKVDDLTKQNQQLTSQNQQLSTDLSSEKQTSAQLAEQNKGLSKKVELGSLLQLKNVEVVGVSKKRNGDDKVEKKAKHVENLRISFETGDNKVLEPGNLSLYLRIINPKGETISVADQGSSTFQNQNGENIQYTKKADFDWAQTNKKVVVYWGTNIKDAGTYKVEIYQSGYMVGSGQVELR